ncbi:N-acetyltransferase [Deinococcus radiomollis]|uniref:N-acetyltransferase n=1 Tax=Deinococcus radiomollis TaxID=468916 RepID=UPI0038920B09
MEEATVFLDFRNEEYPALTAFLTALHPEEPRSADTLRRLDAGRVAGEHHARTLAWTGAELVGMVETERSRQFARPGWYGLHAHAADPSMRAELMKRGLETLQPLSPAVLHTTVSEDWSEHAWLRQHGWNEHERTWLSLLDLTAFRPEQFADRQARAQAEGIEIRTLAELGYDGSEKILRRVYELTVRLLADVPSTDPVIPWPFELWRERVLGHPDFTPDGPLIAVQQGEWVGLTELYLPRREVPGMLHQGLTGVRRE